VVAGTLPYLPDWRSISTKSIMKIRIAQTMKVPGCDQEVAGD